MQMMKMKIMRIGGWFSFALCVVKTSNTQNLRLAINHPSTFRAHDEGEKQTTNVHLLDWLLLDL